VLLAKSLLAAVPNPADTGDAASAAASAAANAAPQDEAEADNWVVACAPAEAEQTRAALAGGGYLDTSRRNQRQQDGRIAIPALAALPPLLLSTGAPAPAPPRGLSNWIRRVPHPVLIGHAASLTPY